jgi:hypothetical protein
LIQSLRRGQAARQTGAPDVCSLLRRGSRPVDNLRRDPRAGKSRGQVHPANTENKSIGAGRVSGSALHAAGEQSVRERVNAPGRTRTCDPRLRRPSLYPAELRGRVLETVRGARRCCWSALRPARWSSSAVAAMVDSTFRGGRSSVGRAPGCGPGGRGFESHRSPTESPARRGAFDCQRPRTRLRVRSLRRPRRRRRTGSGSGTSAGGVRDAARRFALGSPRADPPGARSARGDRDSPAVPRSVE